MSPHKYDHLRNSSIKMGFRSICGYLVLLMSLGSI